MRDRRTRLLLAERVKRQEDTFLAPLIPALSARYDVRLVTYGPGRDLADAIAWSDVVWLEWCWDHAVWATRTDVLAGRPCILRLHSIEALQTDYPARVDWSRITCLTTVGEDIAAVLLERCPATRTVPLRIIANGIDLDRFRPGAPDRFQIGWVGHVEPKKNPMLMVQIAHQLRRLDPRYTIAVAGALTDLRTARYLQRMIARLGLGDMIRFDGPVADMPAWYRDKGILLSTTMYESFGLNIAEAMAVGAFPVIHDFPGADLLWPHECLFAGIDDAVCLIRAGRPGLYRDWVADRYDLERQSAAVLDMVAEVAAGCDVAATETLPA
jgi:glycosyltransferase involved in cell wall biosynthesis